jgi:hypothetical protein
MYLMRAKRWSAQQARQHCIAARSLVCPNDGFWQVLCALEEPLGILNRWVRQALQFQQLTQQLVQQLTQQLIQQLTQQLIQQLVQQRKPS